MSASASSSHVDELRVSPFGKYTLKEYDPNGSVMTNDKKDADGKVDDFNDYAGIPVKTTKHRK